VLTEAGVPAVAVGGLVGEAGVEGEVGALVEELRVCGGTPGELLASGAVSGRMGWGGVGSEGGCPLGDNQPREGKVRRRAMG